MSFARFPHHRLELEESLLAGDKKLKRFMAGTSHAFAAGTTLVHAGSDHEYVYRLVSGWASRTRSIADGRDQIILMFLPGDLFAIKSMFLSQQFDDVRLLTNAVVERVPRQDLHRTFAMDADVANRCMWQVIEEECRLHTWVFALAKGSAEERLAWALLDFRMRLHSSNLISSDALTYPMPLTQAQLGCYLGVTNIHVNRVFRRFRDRGIAAVQHGQVRIQNPEQLTYLAAPLDDNYRRKTSEFVTPRKITA